MFQNIRHGLLRDAQKMLLHLLGSTVAGPETSTATSTGEPAVQVRVLL